MEADRVERRVGDGVGVSGEIEMSLDPATGPLGSMAMPGGKAGGSWCGSPSSSFCVVFLVVNKRSLDASVDTSWQEERGSGNMKGVVVMP